ncbi:hypothetical protein MBLNU457_5201t1 [Dothideomycetes sp. NU457]
MSSEYPPDGFMCFPGPPYPPPPTPEYSLVYSPPSSSTQRSSRALVPYRPQARSRSNSPPASLVSSWRAPFDTASLTCRSTSTLLPPNPPFEAVKRDGTPFIVYHVCECCQSPRSVKYHLEHPVYPGYPPPAPTICRHCKKSSDDRIVEEVFDELAEYLGKDDKEKDRKKEHRYSKKRVKKSRKSRSHTGVTVHVNTNGSSADESDVSDTDVGPQSTNTKSDKNTTISYRHVQPIDRRHNQASIEVQPASSSKQASSERDTTSQKTASGRQSDVSSRVQEIQSRARSVQQEASKIVSARTPPASVRRPTPETRLSREDVRKIAREEIRSRSSAERRLNQHPRAFTYGRFVPLDDTPNDSASSAQKPSPGKDEATQKTKVDVSVKSPVQDRDPSSSGSWPAKSSRKSTKPESRTDTLQDITVKSEVISSFDAHTGRAKSSSKASFGQAQWEDEYDLFLEQYPPNLDEIVFSTTRTEPQSSFDRRREYRRRNSYDTDITIKPQSSVNQRPEMGALMASIQKRDAVTATPKSQRSGNDKDKWRQSDLEDVYGEQELAIKRTVEDDSPSRRNAPLSSATPVPRPRVPSEQSIRPPPVISSKTTQNTRFDVAKSKPFKWSERYDSVPPSRPSSPSPERRISEERRMYREPVSPYRDRLVQERLIRARPPQEGQSTYSRRRQDSPRREQQSRDNRGRAKTRENGSKPAKRLRSILRSSSRSAWESDRENSRGRRVSFSNAIDVEVLSPPPSISDVSKITSDMSRLDPSGRGRRRDDPKEKYYYENARRPDPQRSSRYGDDSDPDAEYRRRQMARALSESPSREKGLKMMRGESPEPRRRERPRKPSEYSPPSRSDTVRPVHPRDRISDSQAGAQDSRDRYPPPSTKGSGRDDARSNRGLVMSGALPDEDRDYRRNDRDQTNRGEGRREAKPDRDGRVDSHRPADSDRDGRRDERRQPRFDRADPRSGYNSDRPREKPRSGDTAAPSAAVSGTSATPKRQVIIDSNGQRRMANVVREGRDKDGRWIEVEEEVDCGRRRGN